MFSLFTGLLLPTNLTLSPHQSLTLPIFFSPGRGLPNLPNAMRLNFSWTQASRQPHLLVTHWLTRISGLLSSPHYSRFPTLYTQCNTITLFLWCCPERRLGSHSTHKDKKCQSHPVIVAGRLTFSFLPHSLVTARRSPGSCFRSCCLYTATFQVTLFQLIKQTLQLCHPWGIAKTHTIKAVLTVSWR